MKYKDKEFESVLIGIVWWMAVILLVMIIFAYSSCKSLEVKKSTEYKIESKK